MEPNNIPLTVLGTVFYGWVVRFQRGSALAANGVAVKALLTTPTRLRQPPSRVDDPVLAGWRPTPSGSRLEMVVGLAAVTPASDSSHLCRHGCRIVAAPLSYYAIRFRAAAA